MAIRVRFLMDALVWIGSRRDRGCRRARGRQGRFAPPGRWPEDGPSLTAAVRDGTGRAQVGAEGWCRSNKRMGLPDAASRTLYRVREAEALNSWAVITVMKTISFRSSFDSPIKLCASNSVPRFQTPLLPVESTDPLGNFGDGNKPKTIANRDRKMWQLPSNTMLRLRGKRNNWLLIKHRDQYALDSDGAPLLAEDRSVASGRTMAAIADGKGRGPKPFMLTGKSANPNAVWESREVLAAEKRAATEPGPKRGKRSATEKSPKSSLKLPDFVAP